MTSLEKIEPETSIRGVDINKSYTISFKQCLHPSSPKPLLENLLLN